MKLVLAVSVARADARAASRRPRRAQFEADIRTDTHGIPHILAEDWGGLGFGYGYAFARDNICTIADSYVTVRAERSRYFGPDAGYPQRGNGFNVASNLNSDFFYQRIIDTGKIEDLLAQAPPQGPRPEVREGVRGYVAGYNRYLAETGVANLPDPRCRGAEWVKPITEIDAYRRFYQLALLASGTIAIDGIASSQPPANGSPALAARPGRDRRRARTTRSASCRSAPTASGSARRPPTTARAWCSPTRTSPGTAPSASTSPTSRSRARSTSRAAASSACRWS